MLTSVKCCNFYLSLCMLTPLLFHLFVNVLFSMFKTDLNPILHLTDLAGITVSL